MTNGPSKELGSESTMEANRLTTDGCQELMSSKDRNSGTWVMH